MASNNQTNAKKVAAHYKTFKDNADQKRPGKKAVRAAAREKMGDAYKTDITKYDVAARGGKKFDARDAAYLRSSGYNDKQIAKYAQSLGKSGLSEGIRLNHANIAGEYAKGNMKKGAKITDHSVGKGFNMSNVKYLQSQGFGDKEIAKYVNSSVKEGGKSHGKGVAKFMKTQGFLDYDHGAWKKAKEKAQEQINNPAGGNGADGGTGGGTNPGDNNAVTTPPGKGGKSPYVSNSQEQNVNQDNDITTNITGDNNQVFNQQDNSIRQYGGDNRSLIINSGSGDRDSSGKSKYYTDADKAITYGTLGGFYAPDDSPAGQAKFMDMNQTFNRDAQKRYANVGTQTASKYTNFTGGNANIKNLQYRIDSNDQYFRDRATIQEVKTYGDRAAKTKYPDFNFGAPIEEITSNAGEIAQGYKKDIKDLWFRLSKLGVIK